MTGRPGNAPLWVLAFDHRNSLRRSFFGITGEPTAADHARARDVKELIFEGVVAAIEQGIPTGQPAILVDEEYGARVIERARERGIPTAVSVEASGHELLQFEHGDDGFGRAIERLDPTYAKVLVRYNPGGDATANTVQRDRLAHLQHWVGDHGRQWMLELLVPPTAAQLEQCDDDLEVYDTELRPDLTVAAVTQLRDHGLAPQLWKLEGMANSDEYAAVAAACGAAGSGRCPEGTSPTKCLVLGRGADPEAVERWLTVAAAVDGFAGFAVGRTLWWQPLRDAVDGAMSRAEAVGRIAANYRRLIDVYLAAAAS